MTKIKLIDNANRTLKIDFLKAALANILKSSDDCKTPSFLYKAQACQCQHQAVESDFQILFLVDLDHGSVAYNAY